jgi:uncharacterized protein (TIGR02996 family)
MNDDAFIGAILEDPADEARRLVYADWLEDQGDAVSAAKAEFLRLMEGVVRRAGNRWRTVAEALKAARALGGPRRRLEQLAAGLDPDWLAAVSRLSVENCPGPEEPTPDTLLPLPFEFVCTRRWEVMRPTLDRAVRHCDACRQDVHYCQTIDEARRHAADGHCVAVDLRVDRRPGDLMPEGAFMTLGVLDDRPQAEERESTPPPLAPPRRERRRWFRRGR